MKKIALVTGISGQDGAYLAKLLISKNYTVVGADRRSARDDKWRLRKLGIENKIIIEDFELSEITQIIKIFNKYKISEVYNLAAQSFVGSSFVNPISTSDVTGLGVLRILEVIRNLNYKPKFYQASSSEMFGGASGEVLNEESLLDPKSPYAAGKVYAHNLTKIYRESYGLHCVNGILFNHESPRRGETFVTRKITRAVGRIQVGLQEKLTLGNLEASRDWGYAKDFVEGMYLMMNYDKPDDWVLATGETHTVKNFLELAFAHFDLNWEKYVTTSDRYLRPNEVNHLLGDSSKATNNLNWEIKTSFKELVKLMVESDLELAQKEKVLFDNGMLKPTWEHPTS